jgi:hypothetical protein
MGNSADYTPKRSHAQPRRAAREHLVRRLTDILAADVAGYNKLTGMDEEGTHVRPEEHLRVLIHRWHRGKNAQLALDIAASGGETLSANSRHSLGKIDTLLSGQLT